MMAEGFGKALGHELDDGGQMWVEARDKRIKDDEEMSGFLI